MTIQVYLVGNCNIRLWGLSTRERLQRILRRYPNTWLSAPSEPTPQDGSTLLLREDYLYDDRVLKGLIESENVALEDPQDGTIVAAHLSVGKRTETPRLDDPMIRELRIVRPDSIASGMQKQLLKFDPPWVARITESNRKRLEKSLFSGAYKGVTDVITRCVWPLPSRWATALCIRLGLSPNQVTGASYVLALLAGCLFWQGYYGLGLLAGWVMTFLDTVDGKLARVTVTSSRLGNIFDHALDLVHPPLWYMAWGLGLSATWDWSLSLSAVFWGILAGYVGGRLCEGAFQLAAPFSMFIWRPFDSLNRLVTARRNPNLLILTLAWLAGVNDIGLLLVMAWTVISTLILGVRVIQGIVLRLRGETPQPWLSQIDLRTEGRRLIVRLFAPRSGLNNA